MRKLGLIALLASAICIAGPPTIASATSAARHVDPGRAAAVTGMNPAASYAAYHQTITIGYSARAPLPALTVGYTSTSPRALPGLGYVGDRPADGTLLVSDKSAVNQGAIAAASLGSSDSS